MYGKSFIVCFAALMCILATICDGRPARNNAERALLNKKRINPILQPLSRAARVRHQGALRDLNSDDDVSTPSYGDFNDDVSTPSYGDFHDGDSTPSYGDVNDGDSTPSYGDVNDGDSTPSYGDVNDGDSTPSYGDVNDGDSTPSYGDVNDGDSTPSYVNEIRRRKGDIDIKGFLDALAHDDDIKNLIDVFNKGKLKIDKKKRVINKH